MINEKALLEAASKLAKLRMTEVFGRKEIPCLTVKSVLQKGLGCLYDNAAITYVLRAGIRYYLEAAEHMAPADGATASPQNMIRN